MGPKLKYPIKYLKSLQNALPVRYDEYSPEELEPYAYDNMRKWGWSNDEALSYLDHEASRSSSTLAAYAGELPGVVVTPDKKQTNEVLLTTYYPVTSEYWATGHSRLDTPGGNTIDIMSDDPDYNLLLNNCSDATRKALEYATGKKINPWFFTTPGDVRSFAEDVLHGESFDNGDGSVETWITLPQQLINKIAQYARDLKTLRLQMLHTKAADRARKRQEKIRKRLEEINSKRNYYTLVYDKK